MEQILKFIPVSALAMYIPWIMTKVGNFFKNKDANTTGADDAFGNVCIALGPPLAEFAENGPTLAVDKGLIVVRDTINNYLAQRTPRAINTASNFVGSGSAAGEPSRAEYEEFLRWKAQNERQ